MLGRIFRAEALNWPWVSSDEYAGQRYYWQSYLMGTTWLRKDHLGKIIGTARGLQFQGAKRDFFWCERCPRSIRRG